MKIAIIISVSEYNELTPLPACRKDSDGIDILLRESGAYSEILHINSNTDSVSVKEKLVNFIDGLKTKNIEELFFFYSGHGSFNSDEFYFLFSNYQKSKINTTSLKNSELDNLFRALSPKITIKVIDACQSGVNYIKDESSISTYLKGTSNNFDKCYFFFSSYSNQSSFQDDNFSAFTKSFLNSFIVHKSNSIRYKDIMDYISDDFELSPLNQKPYFIVQADFTESFCSITNKLRDQLNDFLFGIKPHDNLGGEETKSLTLLDLIKSDADNYCNEDEAKLKYMSIYDEASRFMFNDTLKQFYDLSVIKELTHNNLPGGETIGNWFDQNQHNYFAKAIVEYRENTDTNPFPSFDDSFRRSIYGIPKKKIVIGVQSTTDMPFCYITLTTVHKFPNLIDYGLIILPFISKTEFIIFSTTLEYLNEGWSDKVINYASINWSLSKFPIKELAPVKIFLKTTLSNFESFVLHNIESKFSQPEQLEPKQEI